MPSATALKSKQAYNDRLCKLLDEHDKAFLVHADNVGSKQFMDIRTVRVATRLNPPPAQRTAPTLFLGFSGRAPRPRALRALRPPLTSASRSPLTTTGPPP
mgnify:CR=1 FL=1